MTLYVHGRPPRAVRRRRALIVALPVVLAAGVGVAALGAHTPDAAQEQATFMAAGSSGTGVDAAPQDPALAGVDPELARRFTEAQAAAADAGIPLTLTSGKRSFAEQQALVDAAIEKYGSQQEASRWVLPPETSEHVKGLAVDVGPPEGAKWLGKHGLEHGLCRTYANEAWHFEMLPDGESSCAPMHDDSSSGW
ncbi:M15 family metallopeptidase [Cellulomonas sp. P22]|uniref:M15 family metallopeptidase n=1 Tax=Cellulomonas sp. P22 TaxID=3373189 RepID=UPI0037A65C7C